jgi:hypothetical protein
VAGTTTLTLPAVSGTILQSGTTVTEAQGGTGTTTGYYGFKNRIINGAMVIDQRNAGASITANDGVYFADRWRLNATQNGKGTMQQNQGSVTPPAGFSSYIGFTSNSAYSVLSTDNISIVQNIEGLNVFDLAWGTASAATVTLSFWVRSSLTGTFGGSLENSATNRSYPFSYTISSANTWEQKTITIAGDTSGTWLTTNGIGIRVWINIGTGSNYNGTAGAWAGADYRSATGATSVVGTNGATFYITGVQLEKGSTATSFDYRPYGTELALCQRYLPAVGFGADYFVGVSVSTTVGYMTIPFKVSARTSPTGITTGTVASMTTTNGAGTPIALSAIGFTFSGTESALLSTNVASGLTLGQGALFSCNSQKILFTGCEL